MRLGVAVSALVTVLAVSALPAPAFGATRWVCDERYDPSSMQTVKVNCRWEGEPSGQEYQSGPKPPPMMWIRMGVYSAGEGFAAPACQLVPLDDPIPADHYRATGAECGVEGSPKPSRADVEALVRSLQAELEVPSPTISLGPDPSANEWKMAVVGHPLWLWTTTPRDAASTHDGDGMTISIQARLTSLTFDMGDGTTVTCRSWQPYTSAVRPGAPSPVCGHTYQKASLPRGRYTVRARASWEAQWSAMGYTGTLPLVSTAVREVPVGELQAVVRVQPSG